MPSDVIKAVEEMTTKNLDLTSLLPMHPDMEEDLDYVPEDQDSDVPLHADPIDPDELAELLDSMNQDPQDQGVGLNQDHEVVADPIISENEGVIDENEIVRSEDDILDEEKVRSEDDELDKEQKIGQRTKNW